MYCFSPHPGYADFRITMYPLWCRKQDTPPPSTAPAGDIQHLEKWCKMELEKFNLKDLSFVYLLCSLNNPTDLRSHLTQRLGTSVATERFAEDFIRMRTQGSSGFQNSSRSQAPVEQVKAPAARGKKKKKGGKASKVIFCIPLVLYSPFMIAG